MKNGGSSHKLKFKENYSEYISRVHPAPFGCVQLMNFKINKAPTKTVLMFVKKDVAERSYIKSTFRSSNGPSNSYGVTLGKTLFVQDSQKNVDLFFVQIPNYSPLSRPLDILSG